MGRYVETAYGKPESGAGLRSARITTGSEALILDGVQQLLEQASRAVGRLWTG